MSGPGAVAASASEDLVSPLQGGPLLGRHRAGAGVGQQVDEHVVGVEEEDVVAGLAELLLPLLACVQPASPLHGQTPELRYERLLLALVDGAGAEVLLGEVPNGFPVEILPAGTEILGTAITRFQTVVAAAVPLREPAAEAA